MIIKLACFSFNALENIVNVKFPFCFKFFNYTSIHVIHLALSTPIRNVRTFMYNNYHIITFVRVKLNSCTCNKDMA